MQNSNNPTKVIRSGKPVRAEVDNRPTRIYRPEKTYSTVPTKTVRKHPVNG